MESSFPFSFAFHFFSFLSYLLGLLRQPFGLCIFSSSEMILINSSCSMLGTSVHSSCGTLSVLIPWIYLSLPLYGHKEFDLGHTWMVQWFFPTFFNLSLNFAIRSSWSEPQSAPQSYFCWLYRASPSSVVKNIYFKKYWQTFKNKLKPDFLIHQCKNKRPVQPPTSMVMGPHALRILSLIDLP